MILKRHFPTPRAPATLEPVYGHRSDDTNDADINDSDINDADTGTDAVALSGITKRYGDVTAVAGLDLTVPTGQVMALLGANGAGKSTTVDILLGLRRPDAGSVRIFGRPPRRALDSGDVGAVLQSGELVSGATVGELLHAIAALHPHPITVAGAARRAGLTDLLRRRTERLSGGQAQRVRFAMALVGDPRLLVLDEATAGLDVIARREFWSSVRDYARSGRTVLFSTHYLQEADEMADRIVVVDRGRVVADGPANAIKAATASRTVRCTLPDADRAALTGLPGVSAADVHGTSVLLRTGDSDATLRALLDRYAEARDIDVAAAGLTDAILALTTDADGAPAHPTGAR